MPGLLAADITPHRSTNHNDFTFESLNCDGGRESPNDLHLHDSSSRSRSSEIHHTIQAEPNGVTQTKLSNIKEDDISAFLLSLQSLLSKYTIYNSSKAPTAPVSSGGLQQLLTRRLGKNSEHTTENFSFMQRIKSFYFKDNSTVSFNESTNAESDENIIQFLPVSQVLNLINKLK